MSARLELALAQLLTDSALRERFAREPNIAAEQLGLAEDEVRQLALLDVDALAVQANIMAHKRAASKPTQTRRWRWW